MKKYLYKSRSFFCLAIALYCLSYLGIAYSEDSTLDSTHLVPSTLTPNKEQVTLPGGPFTSDMLLCLQGRGSCNVTIGNGNTCPVGYTVNPTPVLSIIDWYNPGNCFVEGFNLNGQILDTGNGYILKLTNAYGTTGKGCAHYTSVQVSITVYCNPN